MAERVSTKSTDAIVRSPDARRLLALRSSRWAGNQHMHPLWPWLAVSWAQLLPPPRCGIRLAAADERAVPPVPNERPADSTTDTPRALSHTSRYSRGQIKTLESMTTTSQQQQQGKKGVSNHKAIALDRKRNERRSSTY